MKKNENIWVMTKRIVKLIEDNDAKYLYITPFATIFIAILPVVSLRIMQMMINLIQEQVEKISVIFELIAVYLFIDLLLIAARCGISYYKQKYSLNFNLHIKKKVLEKAAKLNLRAYEESATYDMLQRAEAQAEGEILTYFDTIISAMGMTISALSYILIVVAFDPLLIAFLVLFPIIEFGISNRINQEEFRMEKERTDDARKAWYNSYLITSGINYKELKVNDLFNYFIEKFDNVSRKFIKQDLHIGKKRTRCLFLFSILEQLLISGLFAYTIYSGYLGVILIGDVITYTRAMVSAKAQIQGIIQTLTQLNKARLAISQLFDFFSLEEDREETEKIKITKINTIEIKKISFRYPQSSTYALKNISLTLCQGDTVIIVGRNGSGKSTLMKILLGMYSDYKGEIYINGTDLRAVDKKSYYRCISTLFQDFTKYEGTIRENICYSNRSIFAQDSNILEICKKTSLLNLIKNQEKGLDTQLGYWFESGKQLSAGQWQKIALSRSFAKNADVYFFDEPDTALDSVSESEIANLCSRASSNKINIIITHKFKRFLGRDNKIILLDKGEIIGFGTHKELLKCSEKYRMLFNYSS